MHLSLPPLLGRCRLKTRVRQAEAAPLLPAEQNLFLQRRRPLTLRGSPGAAAWNGRQRCYLGWLGEYLNGLDMRGSERGHLAGL